ncbi:MAG: hypothetical protein WC205_15100 [Opitutaceae bacterium]|jgi:hypothetical protein
MTDSPYEKSLRRVLFISAMDGWSISLFAGLCTLISLLFGEWIGVSIGGIITACGIFELRGRKQLTRGNIDGFKWLVRSQVFILCTVLLYASENMFAYDEATLLAGMTDDIRNALSQAGLSVEDLRPLMKPVVYGFYLIVMGVTLIFQGGLAIFYQRSRPSVVAALAARSTPLQPRA